MWPILAALILIVSLLFWKVLILGQVPLPTDMIFTVLPWSAHAPTWFHHPANPLISDVTAQMFPWHVYVWERLRHGEFPLWNPLTLCGSPLFANDQSAVLFPLTLLGALLPRVGGLALLVPLKLVLAGLGTALFLRSLKVNALGAWVGAVAYAFSGYMIVWLGWPHTNVALTLPWLFWMTEGAIADGRARWVVGQALLVGMGLLGGHVETSAHAMYANGFYALWRSGMLWSEGRALEGFVRYATGTALGVLLGAVQILPLFEYLLRSHEWAVRAGTPVGGGGPWWMVLFMLQPQLFGNPIYGNYHYETHLNFNEQSGYAGVVTLCFALFAWASVERRKFAMGISLIGLMAFGMIYGLPCFGYLVYLPGLRYAANGRLVFVLAFAIAVLAGLGVTHMAEDSRRGRSAAAWLLVSTAIVGGWLAWQYTFAFSKSAEMAFLATPLHVLAWLGPLLAVLLVAYGLYAYGKGSLSKRAAGRLLASTIALDMLVFSWGYNPTIPAKDVYPRTPAIDYLTSHTGTSPVFAVGYALTPNANLCYDLPDLRGYDAVYDERWRDFFQVMDPGSTVPENGFYLVANHPAPAPLTLAGVRYILAPADQRMDQEVVWEDHQMSKPIGEILAQGLAQTVVCQTDQLAGFDLLVGTYARQNHGTLVVSIEEEGKPAFWQERLSTAELQDNNWRAFDFAPLADSRGKRFVIRVSSSDSRPGNAVTIWGATDAQGTEPCSVDGKRSDVVLGMRLEAKTPRLADFARFRHVWSDGKAVILENPDARPKAYFADTVETETPEGARARIKDPAFARGRSVVTEGAVDVAPGATPIRPRYSRPYAERMVIDTQTTQPKLLVVGESYDPGWQATIDGKNASIVRANYVFQAIRVPAGNHRVVFSYRPKAFMVGAWISALGALLLGLCALLFRRRPTVKARAAEETSSSQSEPARMG